MYSYGIIGANGPIENVTVTGYAHDDDVDIAIQMGAKHGGEYIDHLPGVHRGQFHKRLAQGGAEEIRLFPKEE